MRGFTVTALEGFPLIEAGDNIARIAVATAGKNGVNIEDGDVLAIAQKVFSKAEGRVVNQADVAPSAKATEISELAEKDPRFVELVLRETKRVLKVTDDILLVEDKRGLICINAGIDKSNVEGGDNFALLPENPDASAEECRNQIKELTGKSVAVIVCDTYSRPFRRGQVNFAIGIAGLKPFRDYRGKKDLFGQTLRVKNAAVADEIAAAAELLMGQAREARPVIIFKGLGDSIDLGGSCRISDMIIPNEEDLFKNTL